jgi:hypothetical protein
MEIKTMNKEDINKNVEEKSEEPEQVIDKGRFLTGEDDAFIREIARRCVGAPYGIAKAEIEYTALHFYSKISSIKDARYRQAVKDARAGKDLYLTEAEVEIFSTIQNLGIEIQRAREQIVEATEVIIE